MRTQFDQQLDQLHVEMIRMGSLCEEVISLSSKALENSQPRLIQQIIEADSQIDRKEREIESFCIRLLLQRQPVARDLRAISAALKMISDMERIGDQAADIAELAPYISGSVLQSKVHLADMARAAVQMVTESIDAFVKTDADLAAKVVQDDDTVDRLFDKIKEELMELIYQKNIDAKPALDVLMAAKYFERIGDHAVNIAEWVDYSITGIHKTHETQNDL